MITSSPSPALANGRRRLHKPLATVLATLAVSGALVVNDRPSGDVTTPGVRCASSGVERNGRIIIATGQAMGVAPEGIIIGLAASLQETGMLNLANPNVEVSMTVPRDGVAANTTAVGILQQTAAAGPAEDLMDPSAAAGLFFTALRDVPEWETLPPAQVAGRVQRSAYPDTYVDDIAVAEHFYYDHVDSVSTDDCVSVQSGGPLEGSS